MNKLLLAAVAAATLPGAAGATVVTLQSIGANGPNDFTFSYRGTLGPDEGVRSGDRLIIFDFAGYIDGSIFSNSTDIAASTELSSAGAIVAPGFTDDPTIANLVFTYTGAPFRDSGGPFAPSDFSGLGARSTLGGTAADAFFSVSTKNNPDGQPGGSGTPIFSLGSVAVPAAVPEPASWALMLAGFGVVGTGLRRSRTRTRTVLA